MIQDPTHAAYSYENFGRLGGCDRGGPNFGGSIHIHQYKGDGRRTFHSYVNCTYGSYGCKDSSLFVGKPGSSGEIPFTIKNLEVFTFI